MDKILARFTEASTYPGLAAVVLGLGEILKVKEAPEVADAVTGMGEAVAATGSPVIGLGILVAGLLGVFLPERK